MLSTKQDILFAIRQIFEELNIELAAPTEEEWLHSKK